MIKVYKTQDRFVIENDLICFIWKIGSSFNEEKEEFYPVSLFYKPTKEEFLDKENFSWFLMYLNDRQVDSKNWKFCHYTTRTISNGRKEAIITLGGKRNTFLRGANIKLFIQIMENSPLLRLKLQIVGSPENTLFLTRQGGKPYLKFPSLTFAPFGYSYIGREINLSQWDSTFHMYRPLQRIVPTENLRKGSSFKGPLFILCDSERKKGLILSYEHGSTDPESFLEFFIQEKKKNALQMSLEAKKGVYFHHQPITRERCFDTVWMELGPYAGNLTEAKKVFWDFLYRGIGENSATRRPYIYYNTWSLQQAFMEKGKSPLLPINEERILKEIETCHEIGVDVFVIDVGWYDRCGDWQPNTRRFPSGFKKIKDRLDELGMKLGVWMNPQQVASNSRIYKEHPEFTVVTDQNDRIHRKDIWGEEDVYTCCFASPYADWLIEKMKEMIDKYGITYFKWDGVGIINCASDKHFHGSSKTPLQERIEVGRYLQIKEMIRIAREVSAYNPDVIVDFDITEDNRAVGIGFLSGGRYFFMNHGPYYRDLGLHRPPTKLPAIYTNTYGPFRARQMRRVPFYYGSIIPPILLMAHCYPHNKEGFQEYNLHTSILGLNGLWGDLSQMSNEEIKRVKKTVELYKKVGDAVISTRPKITGFVGSSPEIYEFIDPKKSKGQVIAFSEKPLEKLYLTKKIDKEKFLCVIGQSYELNPCGRISLHFSFKQPVSSRAAFIMGALYSKTRIIKSTSPLEEVEEIDPKKLRIVNGKPGQQTIIWAKERGYPEVSTKDPQKINYRVEEKEDFYLIYLEVKDKDVQIIIKNKR